MPIVKLLACLVMGYAALAAQGNGPAAEAAPAVAVVVAAQWLAPPLAGLLALAIGLGVDALGGGPLGVHAAILVLAAARVGNSHSLWPLRWAWIIFVVAWIDSLLPAFLELAPAQQWDQLKPHVMHGTCSAIAAALLVALLVGLLGPSPRTGPYAS